jgi:hypothetical protein
MVRVGPLDPHAGFVAGDTSRRTAFALLASISNPGWERINIFRRCKSLRSMRVWIQRLDSLARGRENQEPRPRSARRKWRWVIARASNAILVARHFATSAALSEALRVYFHILASAQESEIRWSPRVSIAKWDEQIPGRFYQPDIFAEIGDRKRLCLAFG